MKWESWMLFNLLFFLLYPSWNESCRLLMCKSLFIWFVSGVADMFASILESSNFESFFFKWFLYKLSMQSNQTHQHAYKKKTRCWSSSNDFRWICCVRASVIAVNGAVSQATFLLFSSMFLTWIIFEKCVLLIQ